MLIKRISPFIMMMMLLAGCYQQANDTFDTVDSQGSDTSTIGITQIVATETSTQEIMVIDPNATPEAVVVTEEVVATEEMVESPTTESIQSVEASPTLRIIQPTSTVAGASVPATQPPQDTQPTATQQAVVIITPDTGPSQLTIPTATTAPADSVVNNGLPPTPTAIPTEVDEACQYTIVNGDNLFRISLNNNVSLEDLLAVNGLSENSIIQPGQVLTLPDCEVDAAETEEAVTSATATETSETTTAGQQTHIVASGETLLAIARRYGVTVNEILAVNNLPDPNRLVVGQQIVIPASGE